MLLVNTAPAGIISMFLQKLCRPINGTVQARTAFTFNKHTIKGYDQESQRMYWKSKVNIWKYR